MIIVKQYTYTVHTLNIYNKASSFLHYLSYMLALSRKSRLQFSIPYDRLFLKFVIASFSAGHTN